MATKLRRKLGFCCLSCCRQALRACFIRSSFGFRKIIESILDKRSITDTPPFTHDLQKLSDELQLEITAEDYDFLSIINSWNIRVFHPDYTKRLYQNTTEKYLREQIEKAGKLKTWLEEKISKQK